MSSKEELKKFMRVIKKSLSSVVVLTTFLLITSAFAMDQHEENAKPSALVCLPVDAPQLSYAKSFTALPQELHSLTIRRAAYEQCLDENAPVTLNKTLGNLVLVCKEWQTLLNDEMKVGTPSWKAWYGVVGHEDIYQQFLNGVLIYRPYPESDKGMRQLKVSDLINPLEGTFDLSQCHDKSKYLSISTGYRKEMKSENRNKLEIWLAPRFMIEKKLKSSASHLQPIMDNWKEETAPFGILWSLGEETDLRYYSYLTTQGADDISSKNLWEHGERARDKGSALTEFYVRYVHHYSDKYDLLIPKYTKNFMFILEPK